MTYKALATVSRVSKESRLLTQERKRDWKEHRSRKRARFRGREKAEIELINLFKSMGIDYLANEGKAFWMVPGHLEGKRVDRLPPAAVAFLEQNYDVEQRVDSENRVLLHFKKRKETDVANYIKEIAEKTGQPASTVVTVMAGLIKVIKRHLRHEHKFQIPKFIRFQVKYLPAKPKRQVKDFFNGGVLKWVEAKDASNKLKIFPAKDFKDYVAENVEVVEPEKKKKAAPKKEETKKKK